MRMTAEQVALYNARRAFEARGKILTGGVPLPAGGKFPREMLQTGNPVNAERENESRLHGYIIAELERRGWYYVHSRMDRSTTTRKGVTDFIIAKPGGITLWVECKRIKSKLTTEQLATRAWLRRDGHHHLVCYSFADFLAIL